MGFDLYDHRGSHWKISTGDPGYIIEIWILECIDSNDHFVMDYDLSDDAKN